MNTKNATLVFLALILLLVLTLGLAYVDLGALNSPVSLFIACVKAALVALFFMHLRFGSGIHRAFAALGALWLAILLGLSLTDYLSRGWLRLPGHWPL